MDSVIGLLISLLILAPLAVALVAAFRSPAARGGNSPSLPTPSDPAPRLSLRAPGAGPHDDERTPPPDGPDLASLLNWLGLGALALGLIFMADWSLTSLRPRSASWVLIWLLAANLPLGLGLYLAPRRPGAARLGVLAGLLALVVGLCWGDFNTAMFGPPLVMTALACLAALGLGLSWKFGPLPALVGLLGLAGAPALLAHGHHPGHGGPDLSSPMLLAWALLFALAQGLGARWRQVWLARGGLAAAFLFLLLALGVESGSGMLEPAPWHASAFLLIQALAAAGAWLVAARTAPPAPWPIRDGLLAQALVALALVIHGQGPFGPLALGLQSLALLALAVGRPESSSRLPLVGLAGLLAMLIWSPAPWPSAAPDRIITLTVIGAIWVLALAALAAMWRAPRPAPLAALAGLALGGGWLVANARDVGLSTNGQWALAALLLALPLAAQLAAWHRLRPGPGAAPAASLAGAALLLLALAGATILPRPWLLALLAGLVPALAWGGRRLPGFGPAAALLGMALTGTVILFPPEGRAGLAMGVLWPIFCLQWGTLLLPKPSGTQAWPHHLLGMGAVMLGAAFICFSIMQDEARQSGQPPLWFRGWTGAELGGLLSGWLTLGLVAYGVGRRWQLGQFVAAVTLLGAAVLLLVLGPVLFANPLFHPLPMAGPPFLGAALLLYLLPALLLGAASGLHEARATGVAPWLSGLALALIFCWVTVSVRQVFLDGGAVLAFDVRRAPGQAELQCYSTAWVLLALALLLLARLRGSRPLTHIASAVLLLAAGKVFFVDIHALSDPWRGLSLFSAAAGLLVFGAALRRQPRLPNTESSAFR